jgi:cyclic-di-AMP phosphodiesterase PgpH
MNTFISWLSRSQLFKNERYVQLLLYGIICLVMYAAMLSNVTPEKVDVSLYSVANKDIQSPITIENKQATIDKQNETAQSIQPVFTLKKEAEQVQIEQLEGIYDSVEKISNDASSKEEIVPLSTKVQQVRRLLSTAASEELSTSTLETLLEAAPSQLQISKEMAINAVTKVMQQQISVDKLESAKKEIENVMPDASLNTKLKSATKQVAQFVIVPNYFLDTKATKIKREEAIEAVAPVMIREGQILVREGEIINREILSQLDVVDLLDKRFQPLPYIGLTVLVFLLAGILYYYLREVESKQRQNKNLLMFAVLFFISILIMKITSIIHELTIDIGFIVPIAMGTMMIKMLINEKVALASSLVFSVVGSFLFNGDITGQMNATYAIYILFSSLAGIFYLGKRNLRSKILKAGLFVAIVNGMVVALIYMLKSGQYDWVHMGIDLGFSLVSGFLAAVLTLGFMPFFEAAFGILSTMRLIELSNPHHPLLRKLLIEAPGTYHHSVIVANLSEAACESIGANGLLARVGAYYHDLGKTKRPHFFIENQLNMKNPHDDIAPQLSKTIIISHPYDGADLLRKHKLPKEIVDIAEQHHGTTLLKYFYVKANSQASNEIPEEEFRYPGPKAQTKESAIVGIADSVEAAVRSLAKPTPQKIEALVRKIIADRLEDGQFDESDLTLKELDLVAKTICETLQGIFHSRIEYPEDLKKKVN